MAKKKYDVHLCMTAGGTYIGIEADDQFEAENIAIKMAEENKPFDRLFANDPYCGDIVVENWSKNVTYPDNSKEKWQLVHNQKGKDNLY